MLICLRQILIFSFIFFTPKNQTYSMVADFFYLSQMYNILAWGWIKNLNFYVPEFWNKNFVHLSTLKR